MIALLVMNAFFVIDCCKTGLGVHQAVYKVRHIRAALEVHLPVLKGVLF